MGNINLVTNSSRDTARAHWPYVTHVESNTDIQIRVITTQERIIVASSEFGQ